MKIFSSPEQYFQVSHLQQTVTITPTVLLEKYSLTKLTNSLLNDNAFGATYNEVLSSSSKCCKISLYRKHRPKLLCNRIFQENRYSFLFYLLEFEVSRVIIIMSQGWQISDKRGNHVFLQTKIS